MSTTGTQIFEMAMALSDNYPNGVADVSDNLDYKYRTLHIINSYLPELYPYSSTATITAGSRPVPTFLTALSGTVDLDDALARGVLVHGVIAMLFVDENPSLANVHEQKYLEKLASLRDIAVESEDIEDEYYDSRMFDYED